MPNTDVQYPSAQTARQTQEVAAASECPTCGYEELNIPREFSERAVVTCSLCDYSRPHQEFYGVSGGGNG
jgi:transcription elongation factor Elf1